MSNVVALIALLAVTGTAQDMTAVKSKTRVVQRVSVSPEGKLHIEKPLARRKDGGESSEVSAVLPNAMITEADEQVCNAMCTSEFVDNCVPWQVEHNGTTTAEAYNICRYQMDYPQKAKNEGQQHNWVKQQFEPCKRCKDSPDMAALNLASGPVAPSTWTYYALGCGAAPYLAQLNGTFDECIAACGERDDCDALQHDNNNRCFLDNDEGGFVSDRIDGKIDTTKETAMKFHWHCAVKHAMSTDGNSAPPVAAASSSTWAYYATGCGHGPYIAEFTGTIDECIAACEQSSDCVGLQHNWLNRCYLDNDDGGFVTDRIQGEVATTKATALEAEWHCAVKKYNTLGSGICGYNGRDNNAATMVNDRQDWTVSPCTLEKCEDLCNDDGDSCKAINWNPVLCHCARNKVTCSAADLQKSEPWMRDNTHYQKTR